VHLERVWATGFRNLDAVEFIPHPQFNLIEGDNGQGKTNLLEAIHLLAGLRSFRTSRISECLTFDTERAELAGRVVRRGVGVDLGLELSRKSGGRKLQSKAWVDGKVTSRAADYLGRLVAVVFTAEHLRLPFAQPDMRRRYVDRALFNHRPVWLSTLRRYEKTLAERNALLREISAGRGDRSMLPIYDDLLSKVGAAVSQGRTDFVQDLSDRVAEVFCQIASPDLKARLVYRVRGDLAQQMTEDQRVQALQEALSAKHDLDCRRGFTSVGPHRDDLILEINGRPARVHASQGQCRALVLAMKIAEIKSLESHLGEPPLLLLDDVSSELDATRNRALMTHLDDLGGQVFLTTTNAQYIQISAPRLVLQMQGGQLEKVQIDDQSSSEDPDETSHG
tara:strand:+ start:1013 stop:2191 length:1179 start_codon:yes stop_codon:yes gene_type:complete